MNKTLFVIAMEKEAIPIIEKLNLKQKQEGLYENEKIDLLIAGIGKQRTAINLVKYLENNVKPEKIINIGYCGSNAFDIGEIINVTNSLNYEWFIPGEEKYSMKDYGNQKLELIENAKKSACYSSESFVTSTDIKEDCIFDMELHSLAIIADIYDIKLMSLKNILK